MEELELGHDLQVKVSRATASREAGPRRSEQVETPENGADGSADRRANQGAFEPGIVTVALAIDPRAQIAPGKESTGAAGHGSENRATDRSLAGRAATLTRQGKWRIDGEGRIRGKVQAHRLVRLKPDITPVG
jgi:hypothetical protein